MGELIGNLPEKQVYERKVYEVHPLGDHLAIKPAPPRPRIRATGIELPETSETRPDEGFVVAFGPSVVDERLKQVGARVAYSQYAGSEVMIDTDADDEDLLIMAEADILCIVTEKKSEDTDSNVQQTSDAPHSENSI